MTKRLKQYLLGLAALVLLALLATGAVARPSRAYLGNHGVPVFGRLSGSLPDGDTDHMKFYAADGTPFSQGHEAVPEGYYLVITDIMMTPDGGADPAAVVSVDLTGSTSGGVQSLRLRSTDNGTLSLHYTVPYFILEPGEKLEVENAWYSEKWAYVNVSGMLVNNLVYLPHVGRR
jgi:hypothetical protein